MDSVYIWISQYKYPAIFVLLMLGIVSLPVPDETLLVFCGYLVSTGIFSWMPVILSAYLGSLRGITFSYGLGHFVGISVISKFGPRLHRSSAVFDRAQSCICTAASICCFLDIFSLAFGTRRRSLPARPSCHIVFLLSMLMWGGDLGFDLYRPGICLRGRMEPAVFKPSLVCLDGSRNGCRFSEYEIFQCTQKQTNGKRGSSGTQ